jgi:two-component system phosphate regulon response regulator PhoB
MEATEMPSKNILVVEDDRALAGVLEYNLTSEGFNVTCAMDGQDALNQARAKVPDLVLLDVMIPVMDGVQVCRQLRSESATTNTPIIMLTAKGEETDQVVGFSVGADDYVTKPFSVRVLLERVKALLRRNERMGDGNDMISVGGIAIDRVKHRALLDGRVLDLTPSEFRLLDTLIRQPGRAFDRSELIDSALGTDAIVLERTIDVHIRSLRKKLDKSADRIETVRGIGYRFCES